MEIRQAKQSDAKVLAQLIYDSAFSLLDATFSLNSQYSALGFLAASVVKPYGQYGFKNHWVVEKNQQVVACISAWHSEMPESFHQATLSSIADYFGLEHAIKVLTNNQTLQDFIPDILPNEWCIGHLSVVKQYQRQGLASALLEFMQLQAKQHKKTEISLDVEAKNTGAIEFYLDQGFSKSAESTLSANMLELGLGQHCHLTKPLI
ncbi:GNAT family N-acetyltransferase [Paraglaciecola aquimarina]|uniref:GNAT family N-acetyltransferase n=1 Tax=Paraglaciecola algarum TaxID=3050085 RepID=A0ABS9DET5_9ALTE|nr:GNAT family N-acetyltransferase [Paraglaciecola sp. G1-23]MCF2950289.1 GNAT family N-acetyltransferase [Paraglaciecola sp. G1-23]